MIDSSTSIILGVVFVLVGALNVCLILQASSRVRDEGGSTRLMAAHRIGGYIFIALFCVIGYFMVARLGDVSAGASPGNMIHLTLAMILSPLLFVKVLIARYYKSYYSLLMPIGLVIFVLSFVLIGIAVGPALAHQSRMQTVSLEAIDLPPAAVDISLATARMEKRCSKCHNLDRIAGARKDARGWLETVNRMRSLPDSGISEDDSRIIVSYLVSQMVPKASPGPAGLEVARALVDQRCGRCHSLDRVYKTVETPAEWSATVAKMVGFSEGSSNVFHRGEAEQIVAYLSATRTPEAVDRRKAEAAAASTGAEQPVVTPPDPPAPSSRRDSNPIAFTVLVCLGALALIVRRPARASLAGTRSDKPVVAKVVAAGNPLPSGPLVLRLASIAPQTPDAKTLRFIVPSHLRLNARPGQFLTFSFLFDGRKVSRSYSICSSPLRSGYVEITPKRVDRGCASVFLNERAAVGMTVEANGAFGHFCFDENKHDDIVMLAAGSGITPMMAMLRYIDDLCLETTVTLVYCVRTGNDIIFRGELEVLRTRLKNFQYRVLLSQPGPGGANPRGRISRQFIEETVKDLATPYFFLCGPPAFMEASQRILTDLRVGPERILQESFGGLALKSAQSDSEMATGAVAEFVRSGKTCSVRGDQTLLDAAEEHGIQIPFSCRQGQCGTCRTKLLSGNVRMDAEHGLDPESAAQGFVLLCTGYADGDVRLDA